MSEHPMMECGHAAQAVDGEGNPGCVICVGINPGATIVAKNPPDLSTRRARCSHFGRGTAKGQGLRCRNECNYGGEADTICKCEQPSSSALPFFSHRPDAPFDDFFCGCWGWD